VQDQAAPAALIVIHDTDRRGPGWGRNQGIMQASTPYVLFLDADDWLVPDAIQRLEAAAAGWGGYVYGDWIIGDVVHRSPDPCRAWRHGTRNVVTALVPTAAARKVGGFDEALPGAEDTDFYLKLITAGICGRHIDYPVLNYRPEGERGREYVTSGARDRVHALINARYGIRRIIMGCCGQPDKPQTPPEPIEDGVLVTPVWHGNRGVVGGATGRNYGRQSAPKTFYIDRRDLEAMPHLYRRVQTMGDVEPETLLNPAFPIAQGLPALGDAIFGGRYEAPIGMRYRPPTAGRKAPDLDAIIRMGREALAAPAPEPAPEPEPTARPKRKRRAPESAGPESAGNEGGAA
jgi:hypothetical protein